jgi:hypothetical protein
LGVPAIAGVAASGRGPYWPDDDANAVIQGTLSVAAPTKPFPFMGPMNLSIWGEYTTSLTATAGSLVPVVGAAGPIAAGQSVKSTLLPYGTTVSGLAGTDATVVLPTYTYRGKVTSGVAQVRDLFQTSRLSGATVSGIGVTSSQTVSAIATAAIAPTFPGDPKGTRGIVTLSAVATAQQTDKEPTPYEFALAASGAVTTGVDAAAVFTGSAIGLVGNVQLERSFDGGQTWIVCNIGSSGALATWSTATPVSLSFGEPEQNVLYRLNVPVILTAVSGIAVKYRVSETGQAARSLSIPTLS